jgi:hypothetical protein
MKLSEKGINRLYAQVWMNQEDLPQDEIFEFETLEFQSDDFEGVVMLTVEEAKKISTFFDVVECCAYGFKLSDEERILWEIIEKRIEQAEKCNETK